MDIAWSDRPPKKMAAIGWTILTVRPGPPVYVRLLGRMSGCMTHFVETERGGQTRPCFGDRCPWCHKAKQRWKGYIPCELWAKDLETGEKVKRLRTLEIPEVAGEHLADKELRGMLVKLWRKDKRRNSSLALDVIEPAHEIPGLTAPWDVRPILRRLFDVEAEEDYQLLLFRMAQ